MQKIATRVFMYSSIVFGILGIIVIITSPATYEESSDLNRLLERALMVTVFVILPSFALSVAAKYLNDKS
jgi:Na+/H+ antiporter NhaA